MGLSARMLAQSAKLGGWQAYVADIYADQDAQQLAYQFCKLPVSSSGFETTRLLSAIKQLTDAQSISGLIYGSGLESYPELLQQLAQQHFILGNSPEQIKQVKDPQYFFKLLNQLNIDFPDIRFIPPDNPNGWLYKSAYSQGGQGIQTATRSHSAHNHSYFQKYVRGDSYSVLFLADGQHVKIIGFNRQYTSAPCPSTPYLFTGIINRTRLSPSHQQQIEQIIRKLVITIGLKGLNSLDFMLENDSCQVLEVNPRPSASMALYDQNFAQGLLTEHIHACLGSLQPNLQCCTHPVRVYHIIYAIKSVLIPFDMQWPEWSADRPANGTNITVGQPISSINVEASTVKFAEKLIRRRERIIRDRLLPVC